MLINLMWVAWRPCQNDQERLISNDALRFLWRRLERNVSHALCTKSMKLSLLIKNNFERISVVASLTNYFVDLLEISLITRFNRYYINRGGDKHIDSSGSDSELDMPGMMGGSNSQNTNKISHGSNMTANLQHNLLLHQGLSNSQLGMLR